MEKIDDMLEVGRGWHCVLMARAVGDPDGRFAKRIEELRK